MDVIVVSIGALAKNPLWGEKTAVRTSHATTTLVRTEKMNLLVDPSLPAQILAARLEERTGLQPDQITHVFLTNWRPVHRRALAALAKAAWWLHPIEREASDRALGEAAHRASREGGAGGIEEVAALLKSEEELLRRTQVAPDELAEGIDLFPLPGYTEGQCGLVVSAPTLTTVIAGDAVPTAGHFRAGQVFADCFDLDLARQSLAEMYEIADLIVPGHDNLFVTPRITGA